ncbi:UvrD-helicase domain-containing protein [Brevibacterium sp. 5221]|uniref:DNA 3'-5' helicase n=1 Tax=Brevibacterium rongguiense TaxID=2695267 RepID=A0A6N9H7C1_9MICO|nr:ATP-dependent DNA helicase UvrD2 [Brevibacterium rongguiense]MYM19442.1 UvrD-helicase domain-containing protein [Brevibacterium rongguiense]
MSAAPGGKDAQALLAALDPEQRRVVEHPIGPLVVLAGAGTGKTRAMTHRIAYAAATGALEPQQVLALTFTAKAAGEMRARLRGLGVPGVQARTFHSAALRQLRFFWPAFAEGPFPELIAQKAGAVARALAETGFEVERETVRDVAAEIEFAAVSMIGTEEYAGMAADRELPEGIDPAAMVRIMTAYGELKTRGRMLDFEDVLLVLTGVLATREDIAAQVHSQYRHFVVDEFQDVSPVQFDLLSRWLGRRSSLCVVGDPAQTIYTFAGATDSFLLGLPQRFEDAATISLVRNYRSRAPIVDAANRVLAHTGRSPLVLQPTRTGGQPPALLEFPDDEAEAQGIAQRIAAQLTAGRRASDIAVLFRTNGQSRALEEALANAGIAYVLRGGERYFARREVKEAMAMLRAARSARAPQPLPDAVAEVLASLGWTAAGPARGGALRERWESLSALVELARRLQSDRELPVPLAEFVAELEDRREHQFAPPVDGVTLASVHAAKGLEWDSVHIVGLSEGLLPISYATTPAQIAEERRLFYVALTRARDELTLSWSLARQSGSRVQRRVSRFVGELRGKAQGAAAAQSARSGARRPGAAGARLREQQCARCARPLDGAAERRMGRCSHCAQAADARVLEALTAWREETAARLRVPAYMVFTTATLAAIAEVVPQTPADLERVPGMGPVKLGQFGAEVVAVVASAVHGSPAP